MMIKMANGIGLKKFLKLCFLITILVFFQTKYLFSNETPSPYQCLDDEGNFEFIIKKYKEDLTLFKEKNLITIILSDLMFIRYCYEKEEKIEEYLKIFEGLIEDKIISKNTRFLLCYEIFNNQAFLTW